MSNRKAFYVCSHDEEHTKLALGMFFGKCQNKEGVIAFPAKPSPHIDLVNIVGESFIKILNKDGKIYLKDIGSTIHLMTEKKRVMGSPKGPLCAMYPTKRLLDIIDDLYYPTEVIVISWLNHEIEEWVATWGAENILDSISKPSVDSSIDNPILEAALNTIKICINTSTGISNPHDKATVIQVFKELKRHGIPYESTKIKGWMKTVGGVDSKGANDIAEIAQGILDGRHYQAGRMKMLKSNIFQQWLEDVKKR
jgi:hypothetical protein